MNASELTVIIGLLVSLSIAAERLVEILKNAIPPLRVAFPDKNKEAKRQCVLQLLAVGAGLVSAWLASPAIGGILPEKWASPGTIVALGLLASGGSGFWNSILSYVYQVKNIKKEALQQMQEPAR